MINVMVSRPLTMWMAPYLIVAAIGCAPEQQGNGGEVAPQLIFDRLTFRVYRGSVMTAAGTAERAILRRDTRWAGLRLEWPPRTGRET